MKTQELKKIIKEQIKLVQEASKNSEGSAIADLSFALVSLIKLHEDL